MEYWPAGQSVQLDAPEAEYVPAEQSVQTDAPEAEYFPAEHVSLHATARPVEAEYLPAAHSAHPEEQTLKPENTSELSEVQVIELPLETTQSVDKLIVPE